MGRGSNSGRILQVKETREMAFAYHRDQTPELLSQRKLVVYLSEITQFSLFEEVPPLEKMMRRIIKQEEVSVFGFFD